MGGSDALRLWVEFICVPATGGVVDVTPQEMQGGFVADDVIVVAGLPDVRRVFHHLIHAPGDTPLVAIHNLSQCAAV